MEPFCGEAVRCYTGHEEAVTAVCTVGARLFTASQDGLAKCFLIQRVPGQGAQCIGHYEAHSAPVSAMCASSTHLYTASHDGTCIEWEIDSGEVVRVFKSGETTLFSRGVTALCIEGASVFISMWVKDGSLFKWDLRTGTSETVASGHEAPITALCTAPGRVFSGGVKGHLREWLTTEGKHGKVMQGHQQEITSLAAYAGSLYSGCRDASIKQWSVDSGRCTKTFTGHLSVVRSIFAGEVGLLSGSADGTVRLWNVEQDEGTPTSGCKGLLSVQESAVTSCTVSDDFIFCGCADGSVRSYKLLG